MTLDDRSLDEFLRRLHLANTRRIWSDLCLRAEQQGWSYRDFLCALLSEEVAHRQGTSLNKRIRDAHFPFVKTVEEFNFTYQSQLRLKLLGSFLGPDFVTDGRSLILLGKPGRGKTHLAVAIALRAIHNGFSARFVTAAALIEELSQQSHSVTSARPFATTSAPTSSSSTRWAISPTAKMPLTSCFTWSTSVISDDALCYLPPTSR